MTSEDGIVCVVKPAGLGESDAECEDGKEA
jgi:hypothetical protein